MGGAGTLQVAVHIPLICSHKREQENRAAVIKQSSNYSSQGMESDPQRVALLLSPHKQWSRGSAVAILGPPDSHPTMLIPDVGPEPPLSRYFSLLLTVP